MEEACPLPGPVGGNERDAVAAMLKMRRIAVVGMSPDPFKPGNYVPKALRERRREIVPVNPNYEEVDGLKCYPTLADVPGRIDGVLVFRRPEFCGQIGRDAAAAGAKGLWLQSGIVSAEAREVAAKARMVYVENRCMMVEAMRESSDER